MLKATDTEYKKSRDMGMKICPCGSDLVYAAFDSEETMVQGEAIVKIKHYRGACTECGQEGYAEVGKYNAIQNWNGQC